MISQYIKSRNEEYKKRFHEQNTLSDGTKTEYINLEGTALDTDFQDFHRQSIVGLVEKIGADIHKLKGEAPNVMALAVFNQVLSLLSLEDLQDNGK